MSATLYGLTKCSTCQKAIKWLQKQGVAHQFIDYREHPLSPAQLKDWAAQRGGFDQLINRSGPTWRNLSPMRQSPGTEAEWLLLIREYPALVRRPVNVLADGSVSVGFSDKHYTSLFPR
ncbi:MAG: Spx/MgsR family RNA polymerase-binding regulatory protein [Dokdonella sp.]